MAKIEGSIYCKNCNSDIKWCYILPQKIGSTRLLEVDTVPDRVILLAVDPREKKVKVHCRNCDCINEIIAIGEV